MAQPGGVLTRAGHTEAGCDLARLAGFSPAAVIVEILNDDGAMARRDDLVKFARRHYAQDRHDRRPHRIPAAHRRVRGGHRRDRGRDGVRARSASSLSRTTSIAPCTWRSCAASSTPRQPTLVRVHRQDTLSDVLGLHAPTLHRPLRDALKLIADADHGVAVDPAARRIGARSDALGAVAVAARRARSRQAPQPQRGFPHVRHRGADRACARRAAHARRRRAEAHAWRSRVLGSRSSTMFRTLQSGKTRMDERIKTRRRRLQRARPALRHRRVAVQRLHRRPVARRAPSAPC